MSKAYDRIEWKFVEAIMKKLGFLAKWINLMTRCFNSVSYSFKVNGKMTKSIQPSRGLRQGDPLSPYIFVICTQGLSSLINGYKESGLIKGVQMASRGPTITHLFFADDSLLFFKADRDSCRYIKDCLDIYERASGQMINYDKSALSFSPHTSKENQERVKHFLRIRESRRHELYLGMPSFSLKNKRVQFGYIKERMMKKIESCQHKQFSKWGKEVLIKAILQAIPTYAINCFRIPTSFCKELDMQSARFWWGGSTKEGFHWKS